MRGGQLGACNRVSCEGMSSEDHSYRGASRSVFSPHTFFHVFARASAIKSCCHEFRFSYPYSSYQRFAPFFAVVYYTPKVNIGSTVGFYNSSVYCSTGNYNICNNNAVYKPQEMTLGALVIYYAHDAVLNQF